MRRNRPDCSPGVSPLHSTPAADPARSRKRVREALPPAHRRRSSPSYLDALVRGGIVLMDHAEFGAQTEKTLRMSDEQVPFGIQAVIELIDQTFLFGFIEIDHDI